MIKTQEGVIHYKEITFSFDMLKPWLLYRISYQLK